MSGFGASGRGATTNREGEAVRNQGNACLDPVMTLSETAGYIKVSLTTIKTLIREGHLPVVLIGEAPRVLKSDIDEFLRARRAVVDTKATAAARREDPSAPRTYRPAPAPAATEMSARESARRTYSQHFKGLFVEGSKCASG